MKITTEEQVIVALQLFNKRCYNAGLYFKVDSINENYIYIKASFDFAYYVNVHLTFSNPVFYVLNIDDEWPDTWNENQLNWLSKNDIEFLLYSSDIEIKDFDSILGFQFNTTDSGYLSKYIIICKSLEIQWEHPYNDFNEID